MKVISRGEFKRILDSSDSKQVRNQVIQMLIDVAEKKIEHPHLDHTNRREILEAISYFKKQNKLSSNRTYKIFLLAEYGVKLVNLYEMRGTHCVLKKHLSKRNKKHAKELTPLEQARHQIRSKRRSSIYGWNGSLMPRSYLDKLKEPIHNQADYDRMMSKITGLDRNSYMEKYGHRTGVTGQSIQYHSPKIQPIQSKTKDKI